MSVVNAYRDELEGEGLFVELLGGKQNHIGGNKTLLSYRWLNEKTGKVEIVRIGVDYGTHWPDRKSGYDTLIPDPTVTLDRPDPEDPRHLVEAEQPADAFFFTHGHEDHHGGFAVAMAHPHNYLCPQLFGHELVRHDLQRSMYDAGCSRPRITQVAGGKKSKGRYQSIVGWQEVKVGPLSVYPIPIPHSYGHSFAYFVVAPNGACTLLSGDFKTDTTIGIGDFDPDFSKPLFDRLRLHKLKEIMKKHKLSSISFGGFDSTNSLKSGNIVREADVRAEFDDVMKQFPDKRLVVFTMSRNHPRLLSLCDVAKANGRIVEVSGSAMLKTVSALKKCGDPTLNLKKRLDGAMFTIRGKRAKKVIEAEEESPGNIITIATGANAEPMSNADRISRKEIEHRVSVKADKDVVVFTTTIIPGNEDRMFQTIKGFLDEGITVIAAIQSDSRDLSPKVEALKKYSNFHVRPKIHSSGHPTEEDLNDFYWTLRQRFKLEFGMSMHGGPRQCAMNDELISKHGIGIVEAPINRQVIRIPSTNGRGKAIPARLRALTNGMTHTWMGARNTSKTMKTRYSFSDESVCAHGLPNPANSAQCAEVRLFIKAPGRSIPLTAIQFAENVAGVQVTGERITPQPLARTRRRPVRASVDGRRLDAARAA